MSGAPSAAQLLEAITPKQEQQLTNFARRRLSRINGGERLRQFFCSLSPEDLVQDAKYKVLLGEEVPGAGRRLKARNRVSVEAFINCLRGIIESDLSSLLKAANRRSQEHLPVGDTESEPGMVDPRDPLDQADEIARRDLRRVVFARLRENLAAEPGLLPRMLQWEEGFLEDDRVAADALDRKPAQRLRELVRPICKELSSEVSPAPTGKEILL